MSGKTFNVSEKYMDQVCCLVAYTLAVPYSDLRHPVKDSKEKILTAYLCFKQGLGLNEIADFFRIFPAYLKNKIEDIEIKRLYDDDVEAVIDVFIDDLNYTNKHAINLRLGFEL
jgi:hypothetical protein